METYLGVDQLPASMPHPVVTIGNFDGIHLGHQHIFRKVVERARQVGGTSVVVTFSPHPRRVLRPELSHELLTEMSTKLSLIEKVGLDAVLVIPFSREFARTSPEAFVREIIAERLGTKELFVGHDFAFGKDRSGSIDLLKAQGRKLGISVAVVGPVERAGVTISSSIIREALRVGEPRRAAELLGRAFSLKGQVVGGYREGHLMGFPTANVQVPEEVLVPAQGVYAVRALWRGKWYDGVANIGTSPTFPDRPLRLEVHLFDFQGDLYDEVLEVAFFERIRDERRFPSVGELMEQIGRDADEARALLADVQGFPGEAAKAEGEGAAGEGAGR